MKSGTAPRFGSLQLVGKISPEKKALQQYAHNEAEVTRIPSQTNHHGTRSSSRVTEGPKLDPAPGGNFSGESTGNDPQAA